MMRKCHAVLKGLTCIDDFPTEVNGYIDLPAYVAERDSQQSIL